MNAKILNLSISGKFSSRLGRGGVQGTQICDASEIAGMTEEMQHTLACHSHQQPELLIAGVGFDLRGWEARAACSLRLQLAACQGRTWPDLQAQLLSVTLCKADGRLTRQRPDAFKAETWLHSLGTLALLYFLLPSYQLGPALQACSIPGACLVMAPAAWSIMQHTNPGRALRARMTAAAQRLPGALPRMLQAQWAQGAVHAATAVAGPALLLHATALLWQTASPYTANMAQAVVGLLAVLADYNCTAAHVRQGRIPQGEYSQLTCVLSMRVELL
jgi:hypothetical protein